MRPDSTSPAWPITGLVLTILFIAGSAFLFFDVRGLRSELTASVEHTSALADLEEELDLLPRVVDPIVNKASASKAAGSFGCP